MEQPKETATQSETVNKDSDGQEQVFSIDGEELTLEELKSWYLRQSDYTKKTQELSDKRKELEGMKSEEMTQDEKKMLERIKEKWFVSKDDLEKTTFQQQQELELRDIIANAPQLKQQEQAIRKIQQAEGWSFEEVIHQYGFMDKDKLEKAKESRRRPMWEKNRDTKNTKSITDLSPEEYAQWKKENLWNGDMFTSSGSI